MPTGSSRVNLGRAKHQLHCSWGPTTGSIWDPRLGAYSPLWRCRGGSALHMQGHPPQHHASCLGAHGERTRLDSTVSHAHGDAVPLGDAHITWTRVPMPPLQTRHHAHWDMGRGLTQVHTQLCAHSVRGCCKGGTAALAHRLRRATPTQRTPTQTAFLPPSNIQTGRQTDTHPASSPGSHPSLRVPGEVIGCVESTHLCLPLCASVSPMGWAGAGERGAWEISKPSWWLGALDQGCCVWGDTKGERGQHTRRGTYAQGECACMR